MSTLRLTTISNQGGTASVPSDTVINGSAKAWVNFNGTGTVAIRASFNVSSITDNGTGDYTVNFTTAMPDANYAVVFGDRVDIGVFGTNSGVRDGTLLTTSVRVQYSTMSGSATLDANIAMISVFR
jgi:hypothetical protein